MPRGTRAEIETRKTQYLADCALRGVAPGTCFCGCGMKTPVSNKHDWRRGYITGMPTRMLPGHHMDKPPVISRPLRDESIPYGLCHCGCGGKAPIAVGTATAFGHVKGQPTRYIYGHQHRINGVLKRDLRPPKKVKGPKYIVKDCGFETECWVWQWATSGFGYGIVRHNGRNQAAHRVAYLERHGSIPRKFVVHHRCENPPCVNPDHLMAVTNASNIRFSVRASIGEEEAMRIHALRATGMKWRAVALEVGVTYENVRAIGCGKRWGDIRARHYAKSMELSRVAAMPGPSASLAGSI
jgi:hypothetical protein